MRISGRAIVVTGASSGLGWATALHLAKRGARVVAAARNEERLAALAALHPGIETVRCDVTVDADRAALIEAAGDVDVLVNNAGLGWMGLVERMPADDVRTLFDTNVVALIDLTQRVLPGMLERGRGHVVNVASGASWVAFPPYTVYAATKWAVQGFTEGLRREVIGRGVTATSINPGPIATEFFERSAGGGGRGGAPTVGAGTGLVARAVTRSIRLRHVPGYQVIAVPRVVGLSRIGAVPVLARAVDVATLPNRLLGR
jgi:3-hydroxy acid dehydrogenase/malonic semialdehyde reductase